MLRGYNESVEFTSAIRGQGVQEAMMQPGAVFPQTGIGPSPGSARDFAQAAGGTG